MTAVEIQNQAQRLIAAHGAKAAFEAAQRARQYELSGDKEQAQDWKKIENALHELRDMPHSRFS